MPQSNEQGRGVESRGGARGSAKATQRLYRDVEKLFRVGGLYQGKVEALGRHIKIVDDNLRSYFEADSQKKWVEFEFLMNGVHSGGDLVFVGERPETTLAYSLFCEGVQSIVLSREITGEQLLQFCLRIRKYFDEEQTTNERDLASILWKESFSNIKIYIYSLLLEADSNVAQSQKNNNKGAGFSDEKDKSSLFSAEDEDSVNVLRASKEKVNFSRAESATWHKRIKEWDLPSGDLVAHRLMESEDLNMKSVDRMREELSDIAVTDRAQKIMRFQNTELVDLASEMESYDLNQVEFNTLIQIFSSLRKLKSDSNASLYNLFSDRIAKITESVIERFHGGLLSFLFGEIRKLQNDNVGGVGLKHTLEKLQKSLDEPKILRQLSDALQSPERHRIALEICNYLNSNAMITVLEITAAEAKPEAARSIVHFFIGSAFDCEAILSKLSNEALGIMIPHLMRETWPQKIKIVQRLLRHPSLEVVRAILPFIPELKISTQDSMKLFERLNDSDREQWAKSILQTNRYASETVDFLRHLIDTTALRSAHEKSLCAWARIALEGLGEEAVQKFQPLVASRRFGFWAKFPKEREAILLAALQIKEPSVRIKLKEMLERESHLLFQDSQLKNKLRSSG